MKTIKVDASYKNGNAGYGFVVIEGDKVIRSGGAKLFHRDLNNPQVAEALGILKVIRMVNRLNWKDVEIQSDSKMTVRALNNNYHIHPKFKHYFKGNDILVQLRNAVLVSETNLKFKFVRRNNNKLADILSKLYRKEGETNVEEDVHSPKKSVHE